jgi:hypothetical protein
LIRGIIVFAAAFFVIWRCRIVWRWPEAAIRYRQARDLRADSPLAANGSGMAGIGIFTGVLFVAVYMDGVVGGHHGTWVMVRDLAISGFLGIWLLPRKR